MAKKKENGLEPVETEVVEEVVAEEVVAEEATEEVAVAAEKPANTSKKAAIGAAVKEWARKQMVTLKRKPQRIPLLFISIVSIIWLFWLFTFSRTASRFSTIDYAGLSIFVNTMLSILIIFLF